MNYDLLFKGLLVSVYGLAGVFAVLVLFFVIIKVMVKVLSMGGKVN